MKKPSFQFYPGDWKKDQNLARASLAAKGAMIEIMCLAFECEKRGVLGTDGKAWSIEEIAFAIGGDKQVNIDAIKELLELNVLKKNKKNFIFSSRMVKDSKVLEARRQGGQLGKIHGVKGKEFGKFGGRPVKKPPLYPPPSSSSSSSTSVKEKEFMGERDENWDSVKAQFLMHTEWMTTFCITKNITANQFDAIAKEFVTDLQLKEDYKTLKDLKSHFTNWFNKGKDKILADLPGKKNGTSARELEEKRNREKLGIND